MLQYRNMNIQTNINSMWSVYIEITAPLFVPRFCWSRSEPGRAETRLGFQPAPGHGARESHGRRLAVDAVGLGHGRCGALGLGGPLGCLQRALGHRCRWLSVCPFFGWRYATISEEFWGSEFSGWCCWLFVFWKEQPVFLVSYVGL